MSMVSFLDYKFFIFNTFYMTLSVHSGMMFKEGKPLCICAYLQSKKYPTMLLYVLVKYLHLQMCGLVCFKDL